MFEHLNFPEPRLSLAADTRESRRRGDYRMAFLVCGVTTGGKNKI